jgi:hypothetical protein
MKDSWVRRILFFAIGAFLLIPCASQKTPRSGELGGLRPEVFSRYIIKTTADDCKKRGGHYKVQDSPLLVDCLLQAPEKGFALHALIWNSVYDYFYRAGTEQPDYGLYSYVLFPVRSPRAERFFEELFKTTGYAIDSPTDKRRLNVIYLPTREDKLPLLTSMIKDGSPPQISPFASQFYDYALAEKLLTEHICAEPAEVIRDLCATDLSRGPYL